MNIILDERFKRSEYIKKISQKFHNKSILILKSNTPGNNKNTNSSNLLTNIFDNLISKLLLEYIIYKEKITSLDGDYFLFVIDYNELGLKKLSHFIETNHPLGKLVDIDIYFNQFPISRIDLKLANRKCFICDNDAHVCTRNMTHSVDELHYFINEEIKNYLNNSIIVSTNNAILRELNLYPKFGLVSKINSGCHSDMDYNTFIKSKKAIMPFIKQYVTNSEKEIDPIALQQIGLKAEQAMFKETNNINTHKGLIFLLGIFLPALVDTLQNNQTRKYLVNNIKTISNVIIGDYYNTISEKTKKSNADLIYLKYNVKGVREEVLNGLETLFLNKSDNDMDSLIYFMSTICDTTVIHKTDLKTLRNVKKEMAAVLQNGGYYNNIELVNSLSKIYCQNNISPGGSADMLVLDIIYREFKFLIKK